ncbi:uncharacterized protein [Diadema setosum]|uniref:uncharacterized protein n=1 Tax=Diadema setosum TaxID=31175 RepID=UPI003B3AEA8C
MASCRRVLNIVLVVTTFFAHTSIAQDLEDAANDGPRLVWTEFNDDHNRARITSLPADPESYDASSELRTLYYYQKTDTRFIGLAGDYRNRSTFWSSTSDRGIFRGGLSAGVTGSVIFGGTSSSVDGMAVDWLSRNLYWVDSTYDWIMISDYNATYYRVLIDTGLEKPRGIVTYPQRGYLFWTDYGEPAMIERATLAGKNRTTIIDTDLFSPNGITVDYETDRIYWVDPRRLESSRIESANLDGSNRTLVVQMLPSDAQFFDLVVFGSKLFVTDSLEKLRCIDKDTGVPAFSISIGARPYGLMTYGPGVQPDVTSPCDSNPCQHFCTGTPEGDFQCVCHFGFELTKNGTSCVQDTTKIIKPQLLLVTRQEVTRYAANFHDVQPDSGATEGKVMVGNRTLLVAIDVDAAENTMFFTDYGKREIYRVRLFSGRSIKTIVGGIGSAEGIAVDWLNQNLYWADASRRHIAVSKYDGNSRKYLLQDDVIRPRSLVIHAPRKYLFWTEFGPPSQIERANLDGTGRKIIRTGLGSPNGLAIDFINDRLYYATRDNGAIDFVDFDGNSSARFFIRPRAKYFDIELFRDYLFFTEWGTNNGLHVVNINTKTLVRSIQVPKTAYGVRMYDDSRQPDGPSACSEESCDQLCLPSSSGGFVCHCSIGYTLDDDNVTCSVDIVEDNFILVADTHLPGIFQISLDSNVERFTALPLEGVVRPIALAYDYVENRVYWTDVRLGSFSRAYLNGTGQETLGRSGIDGPDGLTIDPISRLLYWTDVARNTVTAASLDGTVIKTLIDTDLDQPRGIVLDPVGGYMYYTDWGKVPKIEKAHMDGTNREILVDTEVTWPNGLSLDLTGNKLYWGDAKIDRIERINLDGSDRELIVNVGPRGHPYGVAVLGPHVFWSDWKKYGLMRADKDTGENADSVGPQIFTRISEIHIHNSTQELSGTNACTTNNGGCSHLCIPTPVGRTCACSDGISLDGETNTTCLVSNTTCPSSVSFGRFLEDCTFEPGRRCTVECDPGYWSESKVYDLLCLADGQWENDMDQFCTVVECPELNITENANVVSCPIPPIQNSTCVHDCEEGFTWSSGHKELTCEKDGTWSGPQLYCRAVTCAPLETPPNGMFQPENCTTVGGSYQSTCMLLCRNGYQAGGVTMKSCQQDGRWSDEDVDSHCVDPIPPSFGDTCPSSINVTADRGNLTAFLDWPSPTATDNTREAIRYSASHEAPYLLEEGEHNILIIARDASNNTAICQFVVIVTVEYCDYLSIPLNGQLVNNCSFHYGSVCTFACNPGYRLTGSSSRTCDREVEGQLRWQGDKAVCEAITCDGPTRDAEKVYMSGCEAPYLAGVECTYMCAPGYYNVNGSSLRVCQEDGTWSGTPYYCHVQVCDPIQPFEHGVIMPASCQTVGGTTHNVCTLSCREGFQLQGRSQHECLETGQWSNLDDQHFCEDATAPHFDGTCPEDFTVTAPPLATEAVITWEMPRAVDLHSTIWNLTASRQPGDIFSEGLHAIVVTASDSAGNTATCRFYVTVRVIRCPEQLLPSNALYVNECSNVQGSNCSLECRFGYNLSGSSTKKCVWDGESSRGTWYWLGNVPVCQAITCPPLPRPDPSSVLFHRCSAENGVRGLVGTRCSYMCNPGGFIRGRMFFSRICQPNGTWSGSAEEMCQGTVKRGMFACILISQISRVPKFAKLKCKQKFLPTQLRRCPALVLPPFSRLARGRPDCLTGDAAPFSWCRIECLEGYATLRSELAFRCMSDGQWYPRGIESLSCEDVAPPTLVCPSDPYTFHTPPCSIMANVTIQLPMPTDNSGNVTLRGMNGSVFSQILSRGRHQIPLEAVDSAGNTAGCTIGVTVIAATCERLARIDPLLVVRSTCGSLHGSVVTFACSRGHRLIGSDQQLCLQNGSWQGARPTCESVSCPPLELPPNAAVSPASCATGPRPSGLSRCTVYCEPGFNLLPRGGKRYTSCTENGTWTDDISDALCVDIMPPTFTYCPSSMRMTLPPGMGSMSITWRQPVAIDNSGSVDLTGPDVQLPIEMAPSSQVYMYTATDAEGLVTRCRFQVSVVDAEPPVAINCPTELQIVQAESLPYVVSYTVPTFEDNVAVAHTRHVQYYTRYRWVDSKAYEYGYTQLHYNAVDAAGNDVTCNLKFDIIQSHECPTLEAPPNADLTCNPSGTKCTLSCQPGFIFLSGDPTPITYQCETSGEWNHSAVRDENPYLPVCTQTLVTNGMTWALNGQFAFIMDASNCSLVRDEIGQRFRALFRTSNLFKLCLNDSTNRCDLSGTMVDCPQNPDDDGPPRRRKRRSSDSATSVVSISVVMTTRRTDSTPPAFFSSFNSSVANLWSEENVSLSLPDLTAILDPSSSGLSSFEPMCNPQMISVDLMCLSCPPGTYQTDPLNCRPCSKGTYQDLPGQTKCKLCGTGNSTRASGAFSADQCQDMCQPGTYSYLGLQPGCLACSVGTYQDRSGQRGCSPCRVNTTTARAGSTSSSDCMDPADIVSTLSTLATGTTAQATTATQPSASVARTTKPIPTETTTGKAVPGKEGVHKRKGGSVGLIVGILFGVMVLAAIIAVIVVVWRRNSRQIPMMKLTNITLSSPEDYDSDDDIADGRYHQFRETDDFDLERVTLDPEDHLQAKRNSFSNALYESIEDPKQDQESGLVLTSFQDL